MPRSRPPADLARRRAMIGVLGLAIGMIGLGIWKMRSTGGPPPPPGPPGGVSGVVYPGALTVDAPPPAADALRAPDTEAAACAGCDVVLITVCSLRKDHVGAYGALPGLTPAIDRIAARGVRFERAYAASNFTLAGLTAILTGRFGSTTGVLGWDKGLVKDIPTLPEVLGYYDYRTAAFTIDAPSGFRPDYGLHRGFQHMEIVPPPRDTPDGRFRGGEPGAGGDSADEVVAWLGAQPTDKPLFAMFHTRSAHFPFVISDQDADADTSGITQLLWDAGKEATATPPGEARPGMAGGTAQQGVVELKGPDPLQVQMDRVGAPAEVSWRARYAEAVQRMDIDVARVLDALEARGTLDRTVLILVADHGESLNDHGELLHGDAYWDGVVNVPMLISVPGLTPADTVEGALVSHADILPTILDLVGATLPADIDGFSMVPLLSGDTEAIRSITLIEGGVARHRGPQPRGAVVALPWTLLRQDRGCGQPTRPPPSPDGGPAPCLYNIDDDPDQNRNVATSNPELVQALLARWSAFREARARAGVQLSLDPAFVEELHNTGYDFR